MRVSGLVTVGTGIASVSLRERIINLLGKMSSDDPQRAADLQNFAGRLGLLAPVAKADSFSEEAEWRLFGVEGISMFGEFVFHARPQIGIVPRALLRARSLQVEA
jgi:hypothetical protein